MTQKVSLQKETIRLPSILKQIDPVQTLQNAINTSQKQKEDNTQKMQIIIPQILLKNPSKKLELIIPQLISKKKESKFELIKYNKGIGLYHKVEHVQVKEIYHIISTFF